MDIFAIRLLQRSDKICVSPCAGKLIGVKRIHYSIADISRDHWRIAVIIAPSVEK